LSLSLNAHANAKPSTIHAYEVRSRKDHRGVDLISALEDRASRARKARHWPLNAIECKTAKLAYTQAFVSDAAECLQTLQACNVPLALMGASHRYQYRL
jgi:hypothetical protein